jgi:4-amino-4-deoxy-L-arabinose transferase-like glycosyltransferase
MFNLLNSRSLKKDLILLAILAIFSVPYLFKFKLRIGFPPGYAGFYAQMTEEVLKNNFRYPKFIPYYAVGGVPFAYPPLSFYLMAAIEKLLNIAPMTYILFAPSLFLGFTYIIFYFASKMLIKSRLGAFLATLLFISSSGIMGYHYSAEGMTRAPALLFVILCLYFLVRYHTGDKRSLVFAAISWGLAALTHPSYAVFGAIIAFVFIIFTKQRSLTDYFKRFVVFIFIGLILVSPWLMIVYYNHGISPLLNALPTHGTFSFLGTFRYFERMYALAKAILFPSYEMVVLTGTTMLAFVYFLLKRTYLYPVLLLLTFFFVGLEGQRFIAIVSALMSADFIKQTIFPVVLRQKSFTKFYSFSLILLIFFGSLLVFNRMTEITSYKLNFNPTSVKDMSKWFDAHGKGSYVLVSSNEAEQEWLPYILKMTPLVNTFGAEWMSDYTKQATMRQELNNCLDTSTTGCINKFLKSNNLNPNYLIINKSVLATNLTELEFEGSGWQPAYQNSNYYILVNK